MWYTHSCLACLRTRALFRSIAASEPAAVLVDVDYLAHEHISERKDVTVLPTVQVLEKGAIKATLEAPSE